MMNNQSDVHLQCLNQRRLYMFTHVSYCDKGMRLKQELDNNTQQKTQNKNQKQQNKDKYENKSEHSCH